MTDNDKPSAKAISSIADLAAERRLELLKTVARAALRVKEIQAKEAAARASD